MIDYQQSYDHLLSRKEPLMGLRLHQLSDDDKFIHALRFEVLEQLCPGELVSELLTQCHAWEERERRLNQLIVVYYVIALSLFRRLNLAAVLRQVAAGIRWLWPDPEQRLPTAAALLYRRRQLETPVMRHLFQHVCRPMATQETKGAFRFGLRLMAGASTLDEVPDTLANRQYFGRMTSGKNQRPFPQVRCFYLAEVGTHAIVDAVFAPCRVSEHRLAPVVLTRSVQEGMLVLLDRGIVSAGLLSTLVHQRHAHALARLKADQFTHVEQVLSDGSYLTTLHPPKQPAVQVRIIEDRIDSTVADRLAHFPCSHTSDPADPGQVHRFVTTLLDPEQAPAEELLLCYHERWEIEACIDEQKTHLRLSQQPLRSKEPALVRQELYGLLLAHYTVRWWMHQSALQADLDPDRLSFSHAVEVLETACYQCSMVAKDELPRLHDRLLTDLRAPSTLLPPRRLRFYPRVVKRAYSSFRRKLPEHEGFTLKRQSFAEILLI
jgi:Insertion element 4 transposase N-terminal/Transposase DDE domain